MNRSWTRVMPLSVLLLTVSCANSGLPAGPAPASQGAASRAPKVLTLADFAEPGTIYGFNGKTGGGAGVTGGLLHDFLVQFDGLQVAHPSLAAELPSVERGTWLVNADGTMDVTWKLKPGVSWQDGAPFTSDDLTFTLILNKDPELPNAESGLAKRMVSATNPDPYTFIVQWSAVDLLGASGIALVPLPRHLLEGLYLSSKDALLNSPQFRDHFVGLGPYRLTRWEAGSFIEATRYDGYHGSPARLDKAIVRYLGDQNTAIANIQAGGIDVILPKVVDLSVLLGAKSQLASQGVQIRIEPLPRMAQMEPMTRPEFAIPVNGLPNVLVRRALSSAIDRQAISEVATGGLGPPADSWFDPTDPLRPALESSIAKYPYDPARAAQLLADGGWVRGGDGVLVHSSGERFDITLAANPQTSDAVGTIIIDHWKQLGVNGTYRPLSPAEFEDRRLSATRPGPLLANVNTPNN